MELVKDYEKLSVRSDEVVLQDYRKTKALLNLFKDTFTENKDLQYVSAPQLGVNARAFAIRFNDDIRVFLNPMISYFSKESYLSREKCISNDKEYLVIRNKSIELTFQNKNGTVYKNIFKEPASAVVQCMVDSLEGVVASDYGLEILPEFDEASEEERQEVINMYLEALKTKNTEMQEEIKGDKELSHLNDTIEFMSNLVIENKEQPVAQPALNRQQRRKQDKLLKQLKRLEAQSKVQQETQVEEVTENEKSI